jgi:hypothetical protein
MRRFLVSPSNCAATLASGLLAVAMAQLPSTPALSDSSAAPPAGTPSVSPCVVVDAAPPLSNPSSDSEAGCEVVVRTETEVGEARAYVADTAEPGYTMTLQGPEVAIGRLHPEFVVRLAKAIREARNAGLPLAGVFSAYRPPAFGVGGFSDKFNSLHTYGLAVDMRGIGRPGSDEAQTWHAIAARNGVVCPYGPNNRAEWNHCQPTSIKIIQAANPLRETVTAAGPNNLESMFEAGNSMIASVASAAESVSRTEPTPVRAIEDSVDKRARPEREAVASRRTKRQVVASRAPKRHSPSATAREAGKPTQAAKLAARVGTGKKPVVAIEEGRRKSRSGRA